MDYRDLTAEIVEKAPVGLLLLDASGETLQLLLATPEAQRLLGMTSEELGRSLAAAPETWRCFAAVLAEEGAERQDVQRRQGRFLFIRSRNIGRQRILAAISDVTDREEANQAVQRSARQDSLTGLLTRGAFQQEIDRAISAGPGLSAFIMLDLDDFKRVNDTRGHLSGDALLAALSKKLRRQFREEDLVGRLGGDEVGAFLCDIPSPEYVVGRAAELIHKLTYTFRRVGETVTCSAGIALYPQDGTSFEKLYARADAALYRAKRSGKNQFALYKTP